LLLLIVILGISGCAYFNTYYNAQRYYDEGIIDLERGQGGRARAGRLNESLKVASRVLEFYPESRWVDDALLLMGKSYYHLQNYYNALKKFEELREQFPESELVPEANLWQAKTLLALQKYDEAKTWLVMIVESKAPRGVWIESRMVLGEILEELENWEQAAAAYREVTASARDKRLKGRAWYQLGQVALQMNELELAAESFSRVGKYHPGVDIERRAQLGRIDAEIALQNYKRVEKLIAKGLKDEHFFEEWDEFELKQCLLYEEQRELESAIECYRTHLEEYARLESTAAACFRLGSIYLLHYDQPDSALKYFEQVSREQRESAWTDSTAVLMQKLERLLDLLADLSEINNQLTLNADALNPEQVYQAEMWRRVRSYRAEQVRLLDSLAVADSLAHLDSLQLVDSLEVAAAESLAVATDSLFQSLIDTTGLMPPQPPVMERGRSTMQRFERAHDPGERGVPDAPPPDELETEADSAAVALADSLQRLEEARRDTLLFQAFCDTALYTMAIDSAGLLTSQDSLRLVWGGKIMTLGELYLLEMHRLTDADSLMKAIDTTWLSNKQLVHRRWFIGWMRELEGDSSAANDQYHRLLELYPLSEEAKYLRERLGLPAEWSAEDYAVDMCSRAERMWYDSLHYADAIGMYGEVVRLFPETTAAPQALLTVTWLYRNYLENQTLAEANLEQLLNDYPASPEAAIAERWRGSADADEAGEETTGSEITEELLSSLMEPQQDESGMFIRGDEEAFLEEKLENFREHMFEIGVIQVHRILK